MEDLDEFRQEKLRRLRHEKLREEEWELHLEYASLLTRIRLLSDGPEVHASEALHVSDQKLVQLSLRSDAPATDSDWDAFEEERERNRHAKEAMLNAARATLGFHPAAQIGDAFWEPQLRPDGRARSSDGGRSQVSGDEFLD